MRPLILAMGAGFPLSEEEELLAIKRAGARLIITYFALDIGRMLNGAD